jgi:hypothetical protein
MEGIVKHALLSRSTYVWFGIVAASAVAYAVLAWVRVMEVR